MVRAGISLGPKIVEIGDAGDRQRNARRGASSNIVIGSIFMSFEVPLTSRLVEVPISVQQPPRIEA